MADEEVPQAVWNDLSNENAGEFSESGKPNGQGTMTYPPPTQADGDEEELQSETYVGLMTEGVKNGHGKYTWPDGSTYDGEYLDDRKHGKGTMVFANGDVYTGGFVWGVIAGEGIYKYKNGDVYKGLFYNGLRDGKGMYHFAAQKCQFLGVFEAGAFKEGKWIHCDGSFVTGKFTHENGNPEKCVPSGMADRYFARPGLKQKGHFKDGAWIGGVVTA